MSPQLDTFEAWFNSSYDDDTRVRFVAEAETLGFGTPAGSCSASGTARRVSTPTSSSPTTPVTPATSSAPAPCLRPSTVIVSTDAGHARAIGRDFVASPYLGLRNYVNNLLRHGFNPVDIAGRGSDRLIDALVLHGAPDTIATGLTAHLEAGADHVGVQVLAYPGHDPMPGYRQLAEALSLKPRLPGGTRALIRDQVRQGEFAAQDGSVSRL